MIPDSSFARHARAHRWSWLLVAAAVIGVAACDSKITTSGTPGTWGFIIVPASKNASGVYRTKPLAQFFKGNLTGGVPNSQVIFDSCVTHVTYDPAPDPEIVSGPSISFLDAGDKVFLNIGGKPDTLLRISTALSTTYQKSAVTPITYNPGDSIVVTIPGATAGYPAAEIRGKTSEPFTMSDIDPRTDTLGIPVTWTPAAAPGSSMIISLRYQPLGATRINTQVLCSFTDDGVDTIRYRWHRFWSDSNNEARTVVATRLRTSIVQKTDGVLEILSRFQVPTPTSN